MLARTLTKQALVHSLTTKVSKQENHNNKLEIIY